MPPRGSGVVRPACSAFGLRARLPPSAGEARAGARRNREKPCGADGQVGDERTVERRGSAVVVLHAATAPCPLLKLVGGAVLGIGAMCS